jgi:hypothetical protein
MRGLYDTSILDCCVGKDERASERSTYSSLDGLLAAAAVLSIRTMMMRVRM